MTNSNITKAFTKTFKVTFARFNAISDAICSNFPQNESSKFRLNVIFTFTTFKFVLNNQQIYMPYTS